MPFRRRTMFVLKKNAGSTSMPWLGLVPEVMKELNFFSLEVFYRYPNARQKVFYSIPEAQKFVRDHPDICGTETVICRAKFTANNVTFEPVPVEEIPPERTPAAVSDDPDAHIPF